MSVLRRVTGMGSAGSLALALLAGSCMLAATAGPRQAQATAARALRQTMEEVTPLGRTIVVSSSWARINSTSDSATAGMVTQNLTEANVDDATTQLRRDFSTGPLPLTPQSTDWFGMNPGLHNVLTAPPSLKGLPASLEVTYRYPVAGHLRLVAGSMPDTAPQPTSNSSQEIFVLQVVVTPQTASRFALRPGSQLLISPPEDMTLPANMTPGESIVIRLDVTGIVEPADPGSSFWNADPLLPAPALDRVGGGATWEGAVIADPGEIDMVQQIFGQGGLLFQWELPADTTRLNGQAQAIYNQVNQITNQAPAMTGYLTPMANALNVSSGLVQPLAAFIQISDDVNVLLWLVYTGLAAASVVTLLLAARMIAARRSAELTLDRARGASLWQLFSVGTRGAAVACLPAAALAWAVAVLLVPDAAPVGPAAWWPGIATLASAAMGPGVVAAWQHRLPRRRREARRRWAWLPRVVFEATACAAAIGGITVFRTQTGASDLYASAAPVLIVVPAVIVVLRLYQLLLRGLARASVRQRGVIWFLGLTRAAQAPATLALPAMTLVLALTVASFTGIVRAAVGRAEPAVSWQTTGADVVVASGQLGISPSAVRAIAAVPGVQHAASALMVPLTLADGGQVVTAIVVDPASYAALVASTEGFSPVRPALLTQSHGQGAIPVLASPQAAADLGGRAGSTISAQGDLPALRVQVTGELRSTPALPAGGAYIVLAMSAIRGGSEPPVNLMLLTGPSIDMTRLRAAVQASTQGTDTPAITTRSLALQELTEAPLQQGTFLLFTLATAYAAALALAVMLLELALGTADRELTTAQLATMGLTEGQRVRLVALEVVPAIAASAVAAAACAIALPRLVAPAIDLSVFTHSQAVVPLRPDFASFMLPLAALLAITIIVLAYEIRAGRRRGVAVTMRT